MSSAFGLCTGLRSLTTSLFSRDAHSCGFRRSFSSSERRTSCAHPCSRPQRRRGNRLAAARAHGRYARHGAPSTTQRLSAEPGAQTGRSTTTAAVGPSVSSGHAAKASKQALCPRVKCQQCPVSLASRTTRRQAHHTWRAGCGLFRPGDGGGGDGRCCSSSHCSTPPSLHLPGRAVPLSRLLHPRWRRRSSRACCRAQSTSRG